MDNELCVLPLRDVLTRPESRELRSLLGNLEMLDLGLTACTGGNDLGVIFGNAAMVNTSSGNVPPAYIHRTCRSRSRCRLPLDRSVALPWSLPALPLGVLPSALPCLYYTGHGLKFKAGQLEYLDLHRLHCG